MNYKIFQSLFFIIIFCFQLQSQSNISWWKQNNLAELAFTAGYKEFSSSLNIHHLHGIGKNRNFKIGYGLRFSTYFGQDKQYVTAPAKLTSGGEGPQVLFSENVVANFDTVYYTYPQVNFCNLFIVIQYTFFQKLDVGFNIDAIGFSFGGIQDGGYYSSKNAPATFTANQVSSPTAFNLLLVSDNDIGSLNSELFLRYCFSKHWGVRAGFTFLFTEYTTDKKLRLDNDRFRLKSSMAMLGMSYIF